MEFNLSRRNVKNIKLLKYKTGQSATTYNFAAHGYSISYFGLATYYRRQLLHRRYAVPANGLTSFHKRPSGSEKPPDANRAEIPLLRLHRFDPTSPYGYLQYVFERRGRFLEVPLYQQLRQIGNHQVPAIP